MRPRVSDSVDWWDNDPKDPFGEPATPTKWTGPQPHKPRHDKEFTELFGPQYHVNQEGSGRYPWPGGVQSPREDDPGAWQRPDGKSRGPGWPVADPEDRGSWVDNFDPDEYDPSIRSLNNYSGSEKLSSNFDLGKRARDWKNLNWLDEAIGDEEEPEYTGPGEDEDISNYDYDHMGDPNTESCPRCGDMVQNGSCLGCGLDTSQFPDAPSINPEDMSTGPRDNETSVSTPTLDWSNYPPNKDKGDSPYSWLGRRKSERRVVMNNNEEELYGQSDIPEGLRELLQKRHQNEAPGWDIGVSDRGDSYRPKTRVEPDEKAPYSWLGNRKSPMKTPDSRGRLGSWRKSSPNEDNESILGEDVETQEQNNLESYGPLDFNEDDNRSENDPGLPKKASDMPNYSQHPSDHPVGSLLEDEAGERHLVTPNGLMHAETGQTVPWDDVEDLGGDFGGMGTYTRISKKKTQNSRVAQHIQDGFDLFF